MAQDVLDDTAPVATDVQSRARQRSTRVAQRRLGWALLAVFAVVFVVRVAPGLEDPFSYLPSGGGLPVDSYNDAVFSLGGRALRDLGIVDSKLGGDWGAGDRYADHPPLIYSATAVTQAVTGDDELAARGLALAASLAAMVLLFLLLVELGVPPPLAALSVGVALSVPMFVEYGTMLDTLMLGLPFAAAYLLEWQRSIDGRAHPWVLGAVAAVTVLAAWEGALLIAVTLAITVVVRRGRAALATVVPGGAGLAAGLAATALWLVWVNDGLSHVIDQGVLRAGGGAPVSVDEYLDRQLMWLRDLFGVPAIVLLVAGIVAALAVGRFRPVALATLTTSLVYAGAFHQGSWQHDYWNYWLLITLTLAVGALAFVVSRAHQPVLTIALTCLAIAVVVTGFTARTPVYLRTGGADLAPELTATRRPVPGQQWVPVVQPNPGRPGTSAVWTMPQERFNLGVPLRFATPARAADFARRHPRYWLIVNAQVVRGNDALALLAAS
jgi:hypothetical protein